MSILAWLFSLYERITGGWWASCERCGCKNLITAAEHLNFRNDGNGFLAWNCWLCCKTVVLNVKHGVPQ